MSTTRKICRICGDKALGYNFKAITCGSCKAFFRRNAVSGKHFKCPFEQNCDITVITRKFCQRCRLDKCFAVGMCENLIMSEEEKFVKRRKIKENRTGQPSNNQQDSCSCLMNIGSATALSEQAVPNIHDYNLNANDDHYESIIDQHAQGPLNDFMTWTEPSSMMSSHPEPSNRPYNFHRRELDAGELMTLEELIEANEAYDSMMPDEEEHADSNCPKAIIDFINYTSVKIKKLSTFTQRIQAFRTLCLEDQTALMRRAGLDLLLLKSIMDSINPVTKQLEVPPCNLEALRILGVDPRPHTAFIQAIEPTCFLDKNIALISCAVALFSSDRANFVHREVIEKKQESYKSLLRRYLHSVYAEFEAESMYTNMMQKLTEATRATESFRGVPLKVDTACFETLFGTLSNTDLEC